MDILPNWIMQAVLKKYHVMPRIHSFTLWKRMTHQNTLQVKHQNDHHLHGIEILFILCFHGDQGWCHLQKCFASSSEDLAHISVIAITWFNTPSPLWLARPRLIWHASQYAHCCTSFKWCCTHLAVIFFICNFCYKIQSSVYPKSMLS